MSKNGLEWIFRNLDKLLTGMEEMKGDKVKSKNMTKIFNPLPSLSSLLEKNSDAK